MEEVCLWDKNKEGRLNIEEGTLRLLVRDNKMKANMEWMSLLVGCKK